MSEEDFEKFSKEFLKLIRKDCNDGFLKSVNENDHS